MQQLVKKLVCSLCGHRSCLQPKKTVEDVTPQELRDVSHSVSNAATEIKAVSARIQRETAALTKLADEIAREHH